MTCAWTLLIVANFTAGADLIITNTYQASVDGFVEHLGVTAEEAYELITQAVHLAKKARTLYLEEYEDYMQSGKNIQQYSITIENIYFKVNNIN